MANRIVTKDVSDNIIAGGVIGAYLLDNSRRVVESHASDNTKVTVNKGGYLIPIQIGNYWFLVDTATHVDMTADLDTGSPEANVYYLYAVTDTAMISFKISLNATNPAGYTTSTSKLIGGFTIAGSPLAITTVSIWDIKLKVVTNGYGLNIDNLIIKGGTNTFFLTNGTASLSVSAGAALDLQKSLSVTTNAGTLAFSAASKTLTVNESITLNALPIGGLGVATSANTLGSLSVGLTTQVLVGGGTGTVPAWSTDLPTALTIGSAYVYRASGTDVAVADGGTNKSSWTQYSIPYASATTTLAEIAPAASSILVTSGSNVPSLSTDIPTAVTIGGKYVYRVDGTDVAVADGGTGLSSYAVGDILYASGTTTIGKLANVATGQVIVSGGANAAPAYTATPTVSSMILSTAITDNTATTQAASTLYCKSQDAVLAREPDQGVAMTTAASGSSGIMVADNDNIDFGTGNFTLAWKGSLPNWTSSEDVYLMIKYQSDALHYRFELIGVGATGKLRINLGTTTYDSDTGNTFVNNTTHNLTAVVSVGVTNTTISFYVDGVAFGNTVTHTNYGTISNSGSLGILGDNNVVFNRNAGTTHHAITFNRALTAAEVLDLYRNGVSEADKWGSQTAITSGTLVFGKRYRINTYVSDDDFTNVGASSNASGVEFIATGTTPTHWGHSSSLVAVGATLALLPEGIQPDKWYDASANGLDASYPASGWSLTRPTIDRVASLPALTAFTGTISVSGTTATFSSASDCALCKVGSTIIAAGATKYVTKLTNATTLVIDSTVAWSSTAITSIQDPQSVTASNGTSRTFVAANGSITTVLVSDGSILFRRTVTGNVGIGTTGPNYALEIGSDSAGKPGLGGLWTVVSDERIKTDIQLADLDRCYEIIKSIPLKYFGWAEGVYTEDQVKDRHGLGWIAQDVQKVFAKAVDVKPFTKGVKIPDGQEEYEEQDFTIEKVEKEEMTIEIRDGKPVQVKKLVKIENKIMLFDTIEVIDEEGNLVLKEDGSLLTHQMPRMIKKTRDKFKQEVIEDCLDLNSGQLYAAMYGCIQALQRKIEALETVQL
jgi:hypothetical protein